MKSYLLILATLLFGTASFSQFKTLNVFAPSGLSMREAPNTSSKKTKSIPYGSQVLVLENSKQFGDLLELQEFEDFKIKGYWKKVVFEQETGYVFDGYLSDLPVCGKDQYSTEFFTVALNPISNKYNLKYYPLEPHMKEPCGYEQQFAHGITIREKGCDEIGGTSEIYLESRTFQEAYNFALPIFFQDGYEIDMDFEPRLQELYVRPEDEGAGCYMTIERFGKDGIKISVSCGC